MAKPFKHPSQLNIYPSLSTVQSINVLEIISVVLHNAEVENSGSIYFFPSTSSHAESFFPLFPFYFLRSYYAKFKKKQYQSIRGGCSLETTESPP